MIEKEGCHLGIETYRIYCDNCDFEVEFETEYGFMDIVEQMKQVGWKSRKVGKDWEHYCPGCGEG